IGTDPTGTAARPNATNGIGVQDGPNNKILNNLISGNTNDGIIILNPNATGNVVQGNIVGLNAAGTAPLPNQWYGIEIQSANNTIHVNYIGLWAAANALTNSTSAITLINGSAGNVVGGTAAGQANAIYSGHPSGTIFNGGGNTVSTNSIVSSQTTSIPGSFAF